ncbi:THAP domain-containing protein 7 isoform X2 [Trichomycterus rosablanca]|uniref:THAP domain-containing protein 7 isoform X2 n=1 Tax=Trichomycterus rosablanca TaxID=2290929 RepID=UPI002F35255C
MKRHNIYGYHRLKDDAIPTKVEKSSCRIIRRKSKPRKKTLEKQTSGGTGTDDPRSGTQETQIEEPPVQSVTEGTKTLPKNPAPSLAQDEPLDLTVNPPSPSCYMRRLPPPDGFYVAKEHSYALVYPLVWRRSYEKAISSLQKALRLLSAARRRENRLRLTLTRLREGRVKKTSPHIQDQKREGLDQMSWPPETGRTTRSDLEERELEGASEEIFSEEERLVGSGRSGKPEAGADDEEGYCFYCGRAREDEDPKEDASRRRSRRRTPGENLPEPAATVLPPDKVAYLQMLHLHLLQQDVNADSGAAQTKDEGLCRMFLVPVSAKDRGGIAVEGSVPNVEAQTVPVAEDARQPDDLLSVETGLIELRNDVLGAGQNCHEIKVRVVGGDVKQRLKEHLEGFQLQLSNEFTD